MSVVLSQHAFERLQERFGSSKSAKVEFEDLISQIERDPRSGRMMASSHSGMTYALKGRTMRIVYNVPHSGNKSSSIIILSVFPEDASPINYP